MDDLTARLEALLGPGGVLTGTDAEPYAVDWRKLFHGRARAVLRPRDTAEVAACVRLCAEANAVIVPQGGNTGMVGGASVGPDGDAFVLSLGRLNRIRDVDPVDMSMVVEAGVTLGRAQEAARDAGRRLPLSISSEGTAQIGGVLATNAGGNLTIRHGNARDLVLGIEVVLPDGTVFEGLRRLRKDNTGYCLRQLFVGAEGTLGIITAAVLKLAAVPRETTTIFASFDGEDAALGLLGALRGEFGEAIEAFEYMSDEGMGLVLAHIPDTALPLEARAPCYVLASLTTGRDAVEEVLAARFEQGGLRDAVIADSVAQANALWRLREEHSEAQSRAGASVKNDVSVPVSRVPAFIAEASARCAASLPGVRIAPFGHLGDGNIHFNLVAPVAMPADDFLARSHDLMEQVATIAQAHGGSFSAEHGVGALKTDLMASWRGGAELDTMRRIKDAIDPAGIMNPGKVLPRLC